MKKILIRMLQRMGYELSIRKSDTHREYAEFWDLYEACQPYTMTSVERMYALYKAVEYIVLNQIPGDFIECGVWRGGSSMMIAKTLQRFGDTSRQLYLFDTFEGMSEPTEKDVDPNGLTAQELLKKENREDAASVWCVADLTDVQTNMGRTGYPGAQVSYIKGKVEDTLPGFSTGNPIALLRLDTDWYESTKTEMDYLFPFLVQRGVLLIDDYGHWQGARKAIDEYLKQHQVPLLLNRIDYTGRIGIKS